MVTQPWSNWSSTAKESMHYSTQSKIPRRNGVINSGAWVCAKHKERNWALLRSHFQKLPILLSLAYFWDEIQNSPQLWRISHQQGWGISYIHALYQLQPARSNSRTWLNITGYRDASSLFSVNWECYWFFCIRLIYKEQIQTLLRRSIKLWTRFQPSCPKSTRWR